MASLTKIMTFYTALNIAKTFNIDLNTTIVTVPRVAALMGGTSAFLREGD